MGDIKPNDNATVELLRAFGSRRTHSSDNPAFFHELKWDDDAPDEPTMILFEEFVDRQVGDSKQRESLVELQHVALSRLWNRGDEFRLPHL